MDTFIQSLPQEYIDFWGIPAIKGTCQHWKALGFNETQMRVKLDGAWGIQAAGKAPKVSSSAVKKKPLVEYNIPPAGSVSSKPMPQKMTMKVPATFEEWKAAKVAAGQW